VTRSVHRVFEVVDQSAQFLVEVTDRIGRRPQDGITDQTDGSYGHAVIVTEHATRTTSATR